MGFKDRLIAIGEEAEKHSTITLRDNCELYVENCRCVRSCDDNIITLAARGIEIQIMGAPLTLESFGAFGVKITGKIHSLTLEDR